MTKSMQKRESMKTKLATLLLVLMSADSMAASGWTGPRNILNLEFFSGGVEIRMTGSGGGCTSFTESGIQKTWTKIETGQPNEKQLIAALLMAFAMGKTIDVYCPSPSDWTALSTLVVVP
jgi:hypothetical protein